MEKIVTKHGYYEVEIVPPPEDFNEGPHTLTPKDIVRVNRGPKDDALSVVMTTAFEQGNALHITKGALYDMQKQKVCMRAARIASRMARGAYCKRTELGIIVWTD